MKNCSIVLFVIATLLIPEHNCIIKTLIIKRGYMNPVYANEHTFQAFTDTWNDTTNYELFHWNLPKDLPGDISLTTNVYSIDNYTRKLKPLFNIRIPICHHSTFRWALPNVFIVSSDKLGGPCIHKNNYYSLHAGQLNIEALIPNLGSNGKLFLAEYRLTSSDEDILGWSSALEYIPTKR